MLTDFTEAARRAWSRALYRMTCKAMGRANTIRRLLAENRRLRAIYEEVCREHDELIERLS